MRTHRWDPGPLGGGLGGSGGLRGRRRYHPGGLTSFMEVSSEVEPYLTYLTMDGL